MHLTDGVTPTVSCGATSGHETRRMSVDPSDEGVGDTLVSPIACGGHTPTPIPRSNGRRGVWRASCRMRRSGSVTCPRVLMKSGLPWRWAQCPPSGCWSARSPDHSPECRTNASRWPCRSGRDCCSPVCPSKWPRMRSGSPGRWQRRCRCCLGQPCSARATRFSRGSVPLTASDAASVFSSRPSRSSLAAE